MTVSFAATRSEASEDDAVLEFPVQLSIASSQETAVQYATGSSTAVAGQDYEATSGTLTFPAGTTEQTIRVPIIDDDVVEEEETFTIILRNSNATIGIGEATGAIADNDLSVVSVAAGPGNSGQHRSRPDSSGRRRNGSVYADAGRQPDRAADQCRYA